MKVTAEKCSQRATMGDILDLWFNASFVGVEGIINSGLDCDLTNPLTMIISGQVIKVWDQSIRDQIILGYCTRALISFYLFTVSLFLNSNLSWCSQDVHRRTQASGDTVHKPHQSTICDRYRASEDQTRWKDLRGGALIRLHLLIPLFLTGLSTFR